MKKKSLCLVLAALLTIGSLSGCGSTDDAQTSKPAESKSEQASSEKPESKPAESEAAPELEPVTIQMWLGGPGKQKDSDKVWEAFNEKLQEYVPNTTVEFSVFTTAEYGEKFNQMLAAGEAVDLAWGADWVTGLTKHVDSGNFMELDTLVEEYGQGIVDSIGESAYELHRYTDGNQYYLINWQGLAGGVFDWRMPAEFAALAGDTWLEDTQKIADKWYSDYESVEDFQAVIDQFDIYFNAVKEAGKLYAGLRPTDMFNWNWDTYVGQADPYSGDVMVGVQRGDDTHTAIDLYATDYYRTFAKAMADFYQKGYIRSDIASIEENSLTFVKDGEFTPNTTVLYSHGHVSKDTLKYESNTAGVELVGIVPEQEIYIGKGTSTFTCIPYSADEPERAMMVLNALFTEPELYQLLIYGFEGEHYTDNGDGTITTPYGKQGVSDSDYGLWKWTVGNCVNSLTTQGDVPGQFQEYLELEKTVALVKDFQNFKFDKTPVEGEYAAITAIDDEYEPMIMKGYVEDWEATLDEWIAARQKAGVDKIIAEFQKQLDAFIAANGIADK